MKFAAARALLRILFFARWTDQDEPIHPDVAANATGLLFGQMGDLSIRCLCVCADISRNATRGPYEKWSSKDIQHAGALGGSCLGYERIMQRRDSARQTIGCDPT